MRDKQKPYLYPKLVSILNFIKSKERSVEGCTKLALLSLFHSVENALRDLNEIYNLGKNYEEMISRAIQSLKSCTCSLKMNCVLNALLALNRLCNNKDGWIPCCTSSEETWFIYCRGKHRPLYCWGRQFNRIWTPSYMPR